MIPVGNETLAPKGETSVTIEGSSDKRSITGTFAISSHGDFLPMQLIYGGKTSQSLPRYRFSKGFCLSFNPKHFSNTNESIKFLKEIITPYVVKQRELLKCQVDQKTLVIMDVFAGQLTAEVLNAYEEANILIINVPANMTKYNQPLDRTVNGYAKRFLKSKFTEWYLSQVRAYLDNGVSIDDIEVVLQLSKIKPIHAGWLIEFYNHLNTSKGKEIIDSRWKAAGISDAVKLGSSKLLPIDPFHDIDPMLGDESESSNHHLMALCDVTVQEFELLCGKKLGPENGDAVTDDETDSEWKEIEF